MAQIQTDAVPDVRRAAHAIHEHIVLREQRRGLGVGDLPAIEPGFGRRLVRGLRDGNERKLRDTTRRRFAGRLGLWR